MQKIEGKIRNPNPHSGKVLRKQGETNDLITRVHV